MSPAGLLLAAGAGSRLGTPKALVHDAHGTSWVQPAVGVRFDGGCTGVTVVLSGPTVGIGTERTNVAFSR